MRLQQCNKMKIIKFFTIECIVQSVQCIRKVSDIILSNILRHASDAHFTPFNVEIQILQGSVEYQRKVFVRVTCAKIYLAYCINFSKESDQEKKEFKRIIGSFFCIAIVINIPIFDKVKGCINYIYID